MKNIISLSKKLLAVLLAVSALCFTSCIEENDSDDELVLTASALNGVYKSAYGDSYTIIYPIIKYDDGGYNTNGFTGTIVYTDFITNRIIYQITETDPANTSMPVGKFCVTGFKGLSSTSCKFSNAYKSGKPMYKDSPTEAVNDFTDENGYFGYFGEYAREPLF